MDLIVFPPALGVYAVLKNFTFFMCKKLLGGRYLAVALLAINLGEK